MYKLIVLMLMGNMFHAYSMNESARAHSLNYIADMRSRVQHLLRKYGISNAEQAYAVASVKNIFASPAELIEKAAQSNARLQKIIQKKHMKGVPLYSLSLDATDQQRAAVELFRFYQQLTVLGFHEERERDSDAYRIVLDSVRYCLKPNQ